MTVLFCCLFVLMSLQPGLSGALFVATEGSGKKAGAEDGKSCPNTYRETALNKTQQPTKKTSEIIIIPEV
ncbi:hypothetical protein [Chryseobacterium sp. RLHN22]|uniref:hypothetical protein n=1 Tax=Chryseobacterium sp. RLHN22 TaxID=3437885 RepID=UPI003D9B152C